LRRSPDRAARGPLRKDLLAVGVRAAVVAPEPELRRWYAWQWYWTDTLIDDLTRGAPERRCLESVS
jgi:hypothetical protein